MNNIHPHYTDITMVEEIYEKDFDYDNTQWEEDDLLSELDKQTISDTLDLETIQLLNNF